MKFSEHIQLLNRSIRYLFFLSRTHMICLTLSSILNNLLPYIPIYFSAKLLDALYEGRPMEQLLLLVLFTVGSVFVLSVTNTWLSSVRSQATNEMYRNQNWEMSEKAMQMAYASVEDPDVALLRSRIAMESQTGYNLWRLVFCTDSLISNLTRIIMSLSLTMSFFFLESVPVFGKLVLVGGILLTTAVVVFTSRKTEELTDRFYSGCVRANLFCEKYDSYAEHYSSGKDIRIYDMAEGLLALNRQESRSVNEKKASLNLKSAALTSAEQILSHILRFCVYLILIRAALSGGISVGSIARYVSCVMLLIGAASDCCANMQRLFANNPYMKRFFSLLDIPNPMYQGSLTVEKRDDNEYYVEFRDVSFRYPNTEAYALRHVNLKFKVGEKLAVVGENGSGKTTFIKLMCRLYDPTEGEILLNGVNIKKYDYDEYMSIFSVVFQDFRLFAFRLGENVAAGPEYDREKATQALNQSGLEERLAAMPEGTDSYLYKDFDGSGIEISGGEAQKIALARALYKDAPFLILDEPTAALDPVSEYEIYSSFNAIAGDKTAIYISHRLASCRFCDKIMVFDNGQIVQKGTHSSLIADACGKYHALWHAQAQYYTTENCNS